MVDIAASDASQALENNLLSNSLIQRNAVLTQLSSVTDATATPSGLAIFAHPTSGLQIAFFQTGSSSVTGLAYRTSADKGATWSAPTQVSSRQNVYPSAVINPSTGDIHLIYGLRGVPTLSSAYSIWYRVLAWTGATWSAGVENVVEAGSAGTAFSNPTLAVDSNGFLGAAYYALTSFSSTVHTALSNAAWDLTNTTIATARTLTFGTLIRPLLRYTSTLTYWVLLLEQGGTVRLYHSASVLSAGAHTLTWTADQTFFLASTDQIALAWNNAPTSSLDGELAIAYNNGGNITALLWDVFTNTISAPQVIAPGMYPAITRYGGDWIVGWFAQVTGNQRKLRMAYLSSFNTIYDLDTDSGLDAWAWLRFSEDTSLFDTLPVAWSDNADPGVDGYNVYLGQITLPSQKSFFDFTLAFEALSFGPTVADTAVAVDVVRQGTPISATDSSSASDATLSIGRPVFDTGRVTEVLSFSLGGVSDIGSVAETLLIGAILALATSVTAVDNALGAVPIHVSDTGTATQTQSRLLTIDDVSSVIEEFTQSRAVNDSATALDLPFGGPVGNDVVSIAETTMIDIGFREHAVSLETFGNAASGQTRERHEVAASIGGRSAIYSGITNGWEGRAILMEEVNQGIRTFEDIDTRFKDVIFTLRPLGTTNYDVMRRSADQGRTFIPTGPGQLADIAHSPDGTLWAVGNDGTPPAVLNPVFDALPSDGFGVFDWAVTQRHVFKSIDRGFTWNRVYADDTRGNYGRYPSYTKIAVDPHNPLRIMAMGLQRGSVRNTEMQSVTSIDGGLTWVTHVYQVGTLENRGASIFMMIDITLLALDSGRFLCTANQPQSAFFFGADRVYVSDDMGVNWTPTYADDVPGNGSAAFYDGVFRDATIYLVRNDPLYNAGPNKHLVCSLDNGTTWTEMADPPLFGVSLSAGFNSIAYDYRSKVLYVGDYNAASPLWRLDLPITGAFVNLLENASAATADLDPSVGVRGLGILIPIVSIVEVKLVESAHGVETFPVAIGPVQDTGTVAEIALISRLATDAVSATEKLTVTQPNGYTLRLFMCRGRIRLLLEGKDEPTIPSNPSGG